MKYELSCQCKVVSARMVRKPVHLASAPLRSGWKKKRVSLQMDELRWLLGTCAYTVKHEYCSVREAHRDGMSLR